jgi:crossover junction endodeoxyribonuclease RuvC
MTAFTGPQRDGCAPVALPLPETGPASVAAGPVSPTPAAGLGDPAAGPDPISRWGGAGTPDPGKGGASAPRVIGLDLSLTSTGIADAQDLISIRTVRSRNTGKTTEDTWQRLAYIDAEIWRTVHRHGPAPALIVIEGPSYSSSGAGTWDRAGLWWTVVSGLLNVEIPLAVVSPNARAKYATGKGNASKAAVCSAAGKRYDRVFATDDEADAFVLAAMGLDHLGHPPAVMPAINRAALDKVRWPITPEGDQ